MAWTIQLNGVELNNADAINALTAQQAKMIILVLDEPHFNIAQVGNLLTGCVAHDGSTRSVCERISQSLANGALDFDLLRQASGWLRTTKPGGEAVEEIIRAMFYGELLERLTEYDNNELLQNFRELFTNWLIRIIQHQ